MSNRYDTETVMRSRAKVIDAKTMDMGLRQYMLGVYNYMAGGLALTGLVSFVVSQSPQLMGAIYGTPLLWVVMFAPVIMAIMLSVRIHKMAASTAQMMFWAYAGLMGVSLSYIFMIYTGHSVARMFFISASVFGGMSLYGYTTRKNLTGLGSFLFMGLLGIVIASLVNIYFQSSPMQLVISVLGVLIFTGLTAYDTQAIKHSYYEFDSADVTAKKSIIGALQLYLDFINLFLSLLRLFGERR